MSGSSLHWLTQAAAVPLLAAAAPEAPVVRSELPAWMAGCWVAQTGDTRTQECWSEPAAGMMVGTAISAKGDTLVNWEAMHIDRGREGGRLAFTAQPGGARGVAFQLIPSEAGVTFVNHQTDYPQRVRYWREGPILIGEIAMADGSNAMRWTYRRME